MSIIRIEQALHRAAERAGRPLPAWLVPHLAQEVAADLATEPPKEPAPAQLPDGRRLTPRQRQIAALYAQGLSNKEIADHLYLTEHTVKTHGRRTCQAMGARDRAHAAALATRWGLATPKPKPRQNTEQ